MQGTDIRIIGRYALCGEIAAGGMATVHLGRLLGPVGFSRTVAIKRLHPQFAKDPEFVSMFLDEARLAARIRHPNVVSTLDVVATNGELFLVMEYVQGESLSKLIRAANRSGHPMPPRIAAGIVVGALLGLHAAHEAKNERGEPLGIVHRDISPQNILVGVDGVPRVLDFGVAKAVGRLQTTREGQLKGKLSYMSPEQISGSVTRRTDIYAASVVFWEALTGRRLFSGENEGQVLAQLLSGVIEPPSRYAPGLPPGTDAIVLKGLARDPAGRYASARELAIAIERTVGLASATDIGEWVETMARDILDARARRVAEVESNSSLTAAAMLLDAQHAAAGPQPSPSSPALPASSLAEPPGSQSSLSQSSLSQSSLSQPSLSQPSLADPPVSQSSQLSSISVSTPRGLTNMTARFKWGALGLVAIATVLAAAMFILRSPGSSGDTEHHKSFASSQPQSTMTSGPQTTMTSAVIPAAPSPSPSSSAPEVTSAAAPPLTTRTTKPTVPYATSRPSRQTVVVPPATTTSRTPRTVNIE